MSARRNSNGYAEVKLNNDIHAWSQNDNTWRIVKDCSVYGELAFETKRERRDDLSGRRKYRIVTTHKVTVTLRHAYGKEYTISEPLAFYGGQVAALRQLLEMFESGHLFTLARFDAADKARKAGATQLQLIEADDVYDWRYDERTDWENQRKALNQHTELLKSLLS